MNRKDITDAERIIIQLMRWLGDQMAWAEEDAEVAGWAQAVAMTFSDILATHDPASGLTKIMHRWHNEVPPESLESPVIRARRDAIVEKIKEMVDAC